MVKLSGLLSRFCPVKVLVVGDLMLDTYTTGKVRRISPEAPVSVLHVQKEESRPGGAGNVAINLLSMGASVALLGRIGNDISGQTLCESLKKEGIDTTFLVTQEGYKTPVKNRLIADAQQILRVDVETVTPLLSSLEQNILKELPRILEGVDAIAISDYAKGFLSKTLLSVIIQEGKKRNIPVVVDPKGEDFSKYEGAFLVKPNLQEAYVAAKLPMDASLEEVAKELFARCSIDQLMITRSESGISLFNRDNQRFDFPVLPKEVKDVTGAGDTVLATVTLALASRLDVQYGIKLANIAAAIAVERLGCARITLSDVAERLLEMDVENKIFDEEHLFALQQALKGKRLTVLGIHNLQGMTTSLFRAIRELSSANAQEKLIVYLRDCDVEDEFLSFLSSLNEVDFIVLKSESLKHLCEEIDPERIFILENNQLIAVGHPTALISHLSR
ncbi:MAG: bifunctional protein hldE [Chlamydiota bacterium]|jgi:D-beta-D-heptose 7-phosphate kinase/D-beta-D-heptose 1-phosphate adenosyltransferase